jgi:O-antigen/teichoic acid export membrane protein
MKITSIYSKFEYITKIIKFYKSVFKILISNVLAQFINFIGSILIARWISPYSMGLWNTAMLITIYTPILQLGVFSGLSRELPYLIGRGDKESALKMASVSSYWSHILTKISIVITLVFVIYFWFKNLNEYCYITIAIGVIITCSWSTFYLTTTYRTSSEFGQLAKNTTMVAVVGLFLIILVWLTKFYGLITRASILSLFGVLALLYKKPLSVKPYWDKSVFIKLVMIGMPIYFLGQLDIIFMSLDRLFLVKYPKELGYFTVAIQVQAFVSNIPSAFSIVLYPKMSQEYGENHNAISVWKIAKDGAIAATIVGAIIGVVGWYTIPIFIETVLPRYLVGINAAKLASLIGLSLGLSIFNNVFNVIKKQSLYPICFVIGLATFICAWFLLISSFKVNRMNAAIESMLIANMIMSVSSMYISNRVCKNLNKERKIL